MKKKRKKVLKHCLISLGKNVIPTSGDKIVETLCSENKRICTPALSPPFKVGVLVVFYRQLEHRHNIAWRGLGRKSYIPSFEVSKTLKSPVQGEVSQLILLPIVEEIGNILGCKQGQGGYSGFSGLQVTGMIEWGQKSKPKKIPGPKFNTKKMPC